MYNRVGRPNAAAGVRHTTTYWMIRDANKCRPESSQLEYVLSVAYERQQVSKRGRGIEHVLIDRIKGASEQLWTVVNPTLDEIMENAEVWFDDRKTAAEVLATPDTWFGRLSVATDVLGTRESNAEDEERIRTMEDANGGHN